MPKAQSAPQTSDVTVNVGKGGKVFTWPIPPFVRFGDVEKYEVQANIGADVNDGAHIRWQREVFFAEFGNILPGEELK